MSNIFDTLFIKRFCLPSDIDIASYEEGKNKIITCLCGNYNHACVFYKDNCPLIKANILSYGFNSMGNVEGTEAGIHAEHDAILKLKPINYKRRLININILIIRMSRMNKIQNSKPCVNCIQKLKYLPLKKGYKIKNVYYSDDNGDIIKTNLTKLENEELHYTRFFRRKNIW
jgi:hypothetical protein